MLIDNRRYIIYVKFKRTEEKNRNRIKELLERKKQKEQQES